jgi:hypothetical protein
MSNALFGSIQSARASFFPSKLDDRVVILLRDRSRAIFNAMAMYKQVSSSPRHFPGAIHGTFTMKASTISTERCRFAITRCARNFTCAESLFDNAVAEGMNNADADRIDVKRKADWDRTKAAV